MWDPVRHLLPDSTVFLDLPGHGDQPVLRDQASLQSLADDVSSRLPAGKIQLVGFSLGGLIAQRLAVDLPEKIVSVVAASSVCQRTEQERDAVLERYATAQQDFGASIERSIQRWYPDDAHVSAELVEQTRNVLASNDVESFLHAYQVFATADRDIASELKHLTQPLLAITGALDPGSTPEMSRRLISAVPNGTLQIIDGARHMLPHEYPDIFIQHIKDHFSLKEVGNS
jgi:pimeloyl-ACP methyl ester carboxylesterase